MLRIFKDLDDPAQNPVLSVVYFGDYQSDYPGNPATLNLFDILSKRLATLIVFVDKDADTADNWFAVLRDNVYNQISGNQNMTLLLVMGKTGDVATVVACRNQVDSYGDPLLCLITSNDAWGGSFGEIFTDSVAGFANPVLHAGDTPFVYMIKRNGSGLYTYRVVDKFHMASADTGDAGATTATDLITFAVMSGSVTSFSQVAPFLVRRMKDHVDDPTLATATAHMVGSHTVLDLGDKVEVSYSKKALGAGKSTGGADNLMWKPGAAANKTDISPQDTEYNSGNGQIRIDTYLATGEIVKFLPKDTDLIAHKGESFDLYLKDDAAASPSSKIIDTEGTPFRGTDAADNLRIASFTIGSPLLYVRGHIGDNGLHAGNLWMSPDIAIIHESQAHRSMASVQADLSVETYEEPGSNIYSNPLAGTDHQNRLFMRAFNKGTMKAKNAKAVVYWTPPSTLTMPTLTDWHPVCNIGATPYPFFNCDFVAPSSASPTCAVSEELDWASNLPHDTTGGNNDHFCLVAMTAADNAPVYSNTAQPLPTLAELEGHIHTWDEYGAFVSLPNVSWKNIMTIAYRMSSIVIPPEEWMNFSKRWRPFWVDTRHLKIPIILPTPPDPNPIQLEVTNGLPKTWQVDLRTQKWMAEQARGGAFHPLWQKDKESVFVEALKPQQTRIPDLWLRKGKGGGILLNVELPESVHGGRHMLHLRQLHKGRTIGRLTMVLEMPDFPKGIPVFEKEKPPKK